MYRKICFGPIQVEMFRKDKLDAFLFRSKRVCYISSIWFICVFEEDQPDIASSKAVVHSQ